MAKSAKHKKIRKQEKAKTQLKGGLNKILGKAQNVIEPKLQIKKILVREQLKQVAEGEASTKHHQSIHDVLSALNHHNVNTKTEALSGLYELITTENEVLALHLGKIIDKVGQLTSDLESAVRKENLRVAQVLFSQISEDQIQPFWNLLLTHLKCTLTHLHPSIRQSCLSFLTLLITCCPSLISSSKNIILPSMLNLISSTVSGSSAAPAPTTRLKVDIGDRSTDIKERIRILGLIASCLDLSDSSTPLYSPGTSSERNRGDQGSVHIGLYYPYGYFEETSKKDDSVIVESFDNNPDPSQQLSGSFSFHQSEDQTFLAKFIQSCFPILCQTWVEVAPSVKPAAFQKKSEATAGGRKRQAEVEEAQSNISHLNKNAVEVLQCVVEVMVHLLHNKKHHYRPFRNDEGLGSANLKPLLDNEVRVERFPIQQSDYNADDTLIRELRKTFGQDLRKHFFNSLPFSCVHDSQRQLIISVNLSLFHVAASLRLIDQLLLDKFEKYANGLMKKESLNAEQVFLVLKTASLIRVPKMGILAANLIKFSIQDQCQDAVYDYLETILSLKASAEDAKFADSIDWEYVTPYLFQDFLANNEPLLVSVLTLIAIKKHCDVSKLLQEHLVHFGGILESCKQKRSLFDAIIRLFYYSNAIDLLEALDLPVGNTESISVLAITNTQ